MVLRSSPGTNSTIQLRECDFFIKFFFFFFDFLRDGTLVFFSLAPLRRRVVEWVFSSAHIGALGGNTARMARRGFPFDFSIRLGTLILRGVVTWSWVVLFSR